MKRVLFVVIAISVLAAAGCGSSAKVTGKVHYRGQPVLSGCVIALNDDGTAASGVIQPDGSYIVEGVKKGRVRLGVASPDPVNARSIVKSDNQPKPAKKKTKPGEGGWMPLPKNVGDPAKSGIECDVASSRAEHDIEIR